MTSEGKDLNIGSLFFFLIIRANMAAETNLTRAVRGGGVFTPPPGFPRISKKKRATVFGISVHTSFPHKL